MLGRWRVDVGAPGWGRAAPRQRRRAALPLLGPALVASAAYVDPGNVVTNTSAGASYGYLLVWVVVVANLMAVLVQYLSAKLGLVTGRSLPELLGDRLSRPGRLLYWAQAEAVMMATDLAEVAGGAVALALLFDLPLLLGASITVLVSMIVLATQGTDQRRFERVVVVMLGVVGVGFVAGLLVRPPDPGGVASGLVPGFDGADSVLLAAGMLGATVMPHAIYLHSALTRDRFGPPTSPARTARLLSGTRFDVGVALTVAGAVNLGLLLLGAVALRGGGPVETLDGVHRTLQASLGEPIATAFALALLFSGLASTAVGCYAGSVVMEGLFRVRIPLLVRRAITAVPALLVLASGVDPMRALIGSQVVLSFGIPFALVPLVVLTSRTAVMGEAVNHRAASALAGLIVATVIVLNLVLVVLTSTSF